LAGFPVNIVYAARIEGIGLAKQPTFSIREHLLSASSPGRCEWCRST
jgi:hypothetical protein